MKKTIAFAPSILSASFLNLERDIALLAAAHPAPEWLHIDVMDGHFVPNLTIGPSFVRALKQAFTLPLDVHLMIDNPAEQLDWYLEAGANLLTVHIECAQPDAHASAKGSSATLPAITSEAAEKIATLLARIRLAGALAGISLNPDTPVSVLEPLAGLYDLVLVMSVHPGFGGQSFMPGALAKIEQLSQWRDAPPGHHQFPLPCHPERSEGPMAAQQTSSKAQSAANPSFLIEVDGGINLQTAPLAAAAGADILVAGNAIFGTPDPLAALAALREVVQL